jgi:hypothetical protein
MIKVSCASKAASRRCRSDLGRYFLFPKVPISGPLPKNTVLLLRNAFRSLSSLPQQLGLNPEGEVVVGGKKPASIPHHEVVRFPSSSNPKQPVTVTSSLNDPTNKESVPVLLNSKEHAVGYLSKILNARVYDAAIETELQEAKNLSTVRKTRILRSASSF